MKKTILIGVLLLSFFLGGLQVVSANAGTGKASGDAGTGNAAPVSTSLPNPLGTTNINTFAARLINNILGFVGTISLLLFIYGGIIWMTSAGAPAKVKQGRDILVWAVIGMAVVFTSYILVKFVIQGVQGSL